MRSELIKKHIHSSQLDFVLHELSGWLEECIVNKISAKERAIVSWEEYDRRIQILFERSRKRELIDFTTKISPKSEQIDNQIKIRPIYIKQLDIIGMDDDEVIRAVSDFMRAEINRGKWIEAEIIDEDIARDFEDKLSTFWSNQTKKLSLPNQIYLKKKKVNYYILTVCKEGKQ